MSKKQHCERKNHEEVFARKEKCWLGRISKKFHEKLKLWITIELKRDMVYCIFIFKNSSVRRNEVEDHERWAREKSVIRANK